MLETQREQLLARLQPMCTDPHCGTAVQEAVELIEALGFALDEAILDLRYMGGCPSCKHNLAEDRHADVAVCGKKLFFPLKGCYTWRGSDRREQP